MIFSRTGSLVALRVLWLLVLSVACACGGVALRLPTENDYLFRNQPDKFYMYVDRIFEGETSTPWEGGSFGYVRNAARIGGEVLLTKFHEGIDIAPVNRDKAGNPLDLVSSIADGKVVHTSTVAGQSNYGRYVVVEHDWENSKVYSLYAHLARITCAVGDAVKCGTVLGQMGYTGAGINRTRAHVHLELAMMASSRYEDWFAGHFRSKNVHGVYNGMNLIGTDVARFFQAKKINPEVMFSRFVAATPAYFRVLAPANGVPEFLRRYPWMLRGDAKKAVSWEISFSDTGQPISFSASDKKVDEPRVTAVRASKVPHQYRTRRLISGEGNRASLTNDGKDLVALIMGDFPAASQAKP